MTIDLRTEFKPQHQTRHNNSELEASAKQNQGGFANTFSLNQEQSKYPLNQSYRHTTQSTNLQTQKSHSIDE